MSETAIPSAVEQNQDQLSEVRLELGLKIQTMMLIDTNNTFEKAFSMILVFVITFITVIVSFGFHSQIHINSTVIKIPIEDNYVRGEASLDNMSPFNRFSFLHFKFRRIEVNSDFNSKIHVTYQIIALDDKSNTNYIIAQSNDEIRNVIFRKNNIESDNIELFNDKKLTYKEYKLSLSISGRALQSLTYLEINWGYGDRAITYVFIIIRAVYLLIMLIMFFIYTKLMFRIKFRVWTTEQKLTYLLIIFCFFSDNPFNNIYIGQLTQIIMIISITFNSLFRSFVLFYIISIFRCLKGQFRSKRLAHIWLLSSFFIIATLIDITTSIINYLNIYNNQIFRLNYFLFIPTFCEIFLILLTIFIIVIISSSFDETEFSRFITYSIHTFFMLIVTFPVKIIKNEIQYSYIASLIEMTSYNLFVVSMCYFHWTYTVMTNTSYQDSSLQEIKDDMMIDKIIEDKKIDDDKYDDYELDTCDVSEENKK